MQNGLRGRLFRILRVAALVLVLISGAQWLRRSFTAVQSEQAVINAEILQIRPPITGELEIAELRPGMLRHKGDVLFTVKNPRFGNAESVAQFNGIQNLVEMQQGELVAARQNLEMIIIARNRALRLAKAGLIARATAEDEEARLAVAEKSISSKSEQLARTQARCREMEQQMEMSKESVVVMPMDGLVWSIAGKTGEQFEANKPIL